MKLYKGWIYVYINNVNGKKYVGQTNDLKRRFREHKRHKDKSSLIGAAIQKYGIANFEIKVLVCFCSTSSDIRDKKLNDLETYWIKELQTYVYDYPDNGYNLTSGGKCGRGFHHSEESKRKMSIAKKGKPLITKSSFKKGCIPWSKGKHLPEEVKKKISETKKRLCKDPQYLEKARQGIKRYFETHDHPLKGTHLSEERKKHLSNYFKGRPNPKNAGKNNGMYGKAAPNRKPVIQCDLNGNKIREWDGRGVAERELGITNVFRACKTGKSAGGYLWKYK